MKGAPGGLVSSEDYKNGKSRAVSRVDKKSASRVRSDRQFVTNNALHYASICQVWYPASAITSTPTANIIGRVGTRLTT